LRILGQKGHCSYLAVKAGPLMTIGRRDFLRTGLLAAGAVAAGGAVAKAVASAKRITLPVLTPHGTIAQITVDHPLPQLSQVTAAAASARARTGIPGKRWVMVIDLGKCDGCGKCTTACGKMHFIPPDRQYIPVLVMRDAKEEAPYYFPKPCYHCDNPPCTKVCPVDATFKTQDGTVLIDNDRCIGCRFCMAACPYGARSFNWGPPDITSEQMAQGYSPEWGYPRKMGTVEKCDFCPDHAAMGMLPACSSGCPMGAIYYGDENEDAVTNSGGETLRFSALLKDRAAYRHLEYLGTKPRVYYLPPVHRQYPAPDEAKGHAS
jgi:Fe-S-cluster-containing dehydrogenase component